MVFLSPGAPLKECTTLLWGPDGRVHYEVAGVSTCWPGHSENFSIVQRYWKKTNCWARDIWSLVGPVASVTPLARLQNPPRPQSCCRSGPLLCNSRCPKPVRISGLRTGTRFSYVHSSHSAYWVQPIFRPTYYYAFETGDDVEESPYTCFSSIKLYVLQTRQFTSTYKTPVEIITANGVYQRGISVSAYVLGKAWHHSAASNDLYLFVWQWYTASLSCFIKPPFWKSERSELQSKITMKELEYLWHLSN